MFAELSSSLIDLDEETRMRLASLLEKRNSFMEKQAKLNQLQIYMLYSPSQANEEAVSDFASAVVAPLRTAMVEDIRFLLEKSVDLEKLSEMLPMIVAGLLQSVNIELLLATYGIPVDVADKLVADIAEYIKSGL